MISTLEEKPHVPAAPRKRKVPGWAVAMLGVAGAIALLSITSYQTGFPQLTSSGTTQTAVRLALPILLAGLGGLWAERAGVVNIGLEGMMIMGTWGAAWAGYQWGPWAALVAAVVFGSLGGLLHAIATVTFGVNHIVSGVAINLLGAGLTKYLSTLIFLPLSNNPRSRRRSSRSARSRWWASVTGSVSSKPGSDCSSRTSPASCAVSSPASRR